jgi:hypothetical protein
MERFGPVKIPRVVRETREHTRWALPAWPAGFGLLRCQPELRCRGFPQIEGLLRLGPAGVYLAGSAVLVVGEEDSVTLLPDGSLCLLIEWNQFLIFFSAETWYNYKDM